MQFFALRLRVIFIISLVSQIVLSLSLHNYFSNDNFYITSAPPSKNILNLIGIGDHQYTYRLLGQYLQHMGQNHRSNNINNYNYILLKQWFETLSSLDLKSSYIPSIAAYHYGHTTLLTNQLIIAEYLYNFANKCRSSMQKEWYFEALYIALYKLRNADLAEKIAQDIISNSSVSLILKAKIPWLLYKMGRECSAHKMSLHINSKEIKEQILTLNQQLSIEKSHEDITQITLDHLEFLKNNPSLKLKCDLKK